MKILVALGLNLFADSVVLFVASDYDHHHTLWEWRCLYESQELQIWGMGFEFKHLKVF